MRHFAATHGDELPYYWIIFVFLARQTISFSHALNRAYICKLWQGKFMATEIYAAHAKRIRRYNKAGFRLACHIAAMLCDHCLPFQSYSFQRPHRFMPFH